MNESDELTVVVVIVVGGRLYEEEILLEVSPAEELASADDELVAFLQWPSADETTETGQVEGQ